MPRGDAARRGGGRRRPAARGRAPHALPVTWDGPCPLRVVRTGGRGPAAARNAGWRSTSPDVVWVAFLDDDVVLPAAWAGGLAKDLANAAPDVAGVQGRIVVPLPADRRPTDWERSTAGLEHAAWATADMAYRRSVLKRVSGFDERFPRAYREDADLALRVRAVGGHLVRGERTITHPVRPADDAVSLRVQRGNRDDALLRALYGPRWRERPVGGVAIAGRRVTAVGIASGRGRGHGRHSFGRADFHDPRPRARSHVGRRGDGWARERAATR
ncbi:glycosyltransferase family 2 protein [Isoptericola variabilis]|uniref:glycosyltransferase family 2 protein n=1 Tax=Isoptericola variabilis TaxID=139208 RepID=UPI001E4E5C5E|nr:glycosyltransferase family 2 protein [Isoptericola variabilis]